MRWISRSIVLRYLFIVGIIVTGILIERTLSGLEHAVILIVGLLAALIWLVYYHIALQSRFERFEERG